MGLSRDQRPKLSAITLSCPGICPTSISVPVMAQKRQKKPTKKHRGRDMVKIGGQVPNLCQPVVLYETTHSPALLCGDISKGLSIATSTTPSISCSHR